MSARKRSPKALLQRIDREYFLRVSGMQRWRWILAFGTIAVLLVWLALQVFIGRNQVYSAGPLSPSHAMLNRRCEVCHAGSAFAIRVTDKACSTCHSGAVHQDRQTFMPACVDCHREHTGTTLTTVSDRECVRCHGDLRVTSGGVKVAGEIHSFTRDHPEFKMRSVTSGLKFNHAIHLKKDLRTPSGFATVVCLDCHRENNTKPWPWVSVNYYPNCSTCHPLTFDRRFSEPAPHENFDRIHEFITQRFTEWIEAHPEELRAMPPDIRIPTSPAAAPARTASAWIAARVAESEELLRRKTCKECHTTIAGDKDFAAPSLAFTHAKFEHSAHQLMDCTECHKQAASGAMLLPGIAVCRECHVSNVQDAASGSCAECHVYHDPAKHKHVEGSFTVVH